MLAIQADENGIPIVIETTQGPGGTKMFQPVTADRWRQILEEEMDLSETDRPIIPIHAIPINAGVTV